MSATVVSKTEELSHEQWLEQRRKGIGGSDIGAIAGLSKWSSPIKVYLSKVEGIQDDISNEDAVYWGNRLEDIVAEEYSRRTGNKIRRRNAVLQHPEYEWALANVDRLIVANDERGPGVLEVKTANAFVLKEWEGDEVPASYLVQLQWYLFVTGYKWGAFAALIGGQKFVMKEIERDDELIDQLVSIADEFWNNHVLAKIPPDFDGSNASSELLMKMYPESLPESEVELELEADELLEAYEQAKIEEKEAAERKKEAENKLKAMLGEYEVGVASEKVITWKTISSRRIDTKSLKEDHPDIYDQYAKESKSRRFSVN